MRSPIAAERAVAFRTPMAGWLPGAGLLDRSSRGLHIIEGGDASIEDPPFFPHVLDQRGQSRAGRETLFFAQLAAAVLVAAEAAAGGSARRETTVTASCLPCGAGHAIPAVWRWRSARSA